MRCKTHGDKFSGKWFEPKISWKTFANVRLSDDNALSLIDRTILATVNRLWSEVLIFPGRSGFESL